LMSVNQTAMKGENITKRLSWGSTSFSDQHSGNSEIRPRRSISQTDSENRGILRQKNGESDIRHVRQYLSMSSVSSLHRTNGNFFPDCDTASNADDPRRNEVSLNQGTGLTSNKRSDSLPTMSLSSDFLEGTPAAQLRADRRNSFPPPSSDNKLDQSTSLDASRGGPDAIKVDTASIYRDFLRRIKSEPQPAAPSTASSTNRPTHTDPRRQNESSSISSSPVGRAQPRRRQGREPGPERQPGCLGIAWPFFRRTAV
jgi:hypothetical protein